MSEERDLEREALERDANEKRGRLLRTIETLKHRGQSAMVPLQRARAYGLPMVSVAAGLIKSGVKLLAVRIGKHLRDRHSPA